MAEQKMTKELWVQMFRDVGLDDKSMDRWHQGFEKQAPEAHQSFLEWLNIPEDEIKKIRESSRQS